WPDKASNSDLDGKLQDALVTVRTSQFAEGRVGDPRIGLAEVSPVGHIEGFKAKLAQPGLAQHGKPESLHHGEVQICEARAFENIATQRAQRVWSRIAETGYVEVPVDLLAFASVSGQHRISCADQIDTRAGNACQRVTGGADSEE